MKKIFLFLPFLFLSVSLLYASFFDTGYVEWSQPNGVKFTARLWGDEFSSQMETNTGYRIIIGSDNYYYYAMLDSTGDYTPSNRRVNIDQPLTESYHLERSSSWDAILQQRIEAFNAQLELNYQAYLNKMASGDSVYKIGVVLIDFTPSEKHITQQYQNGYNSYFYDSLIFSRNYWNDTTGAIHPQGLDLFGSFADYWDDQSLGKLKFTGRGGDRKIVNPDTLIGGVAYPKWVVMPREKGYYKNKPWIYDLFDSAACVQLGVDLKSVYNKVIFIYAGDQNLLGASTPGLNNISYIMSETTTDEVYGQFFSHIGSHVHEFGHNIGLGHIGGGKIPVSDNMGFYWNLMGYSQNGPRYRGACPSRLAPYHALDKLKFFQYDTISVDTNLTIRYNPDQPKLYYIQSKYSNQYFVLENRLKKGYDLWTPHNENLNLPVDPDSIDPNHNNGGLLIWRNGKNLMCADRLPTDHEGQVREKDSVKQSLQRDPFPYNQRDGLRSGIDFNDFTIPSSNILNGDNITNGPYSHVAIHNITWNPADSTTTVNLFLDYGTETISGTTVWNNSKTLDRDVVVKPGGRLTINPGTVVQSGINGGEKFSITVENGGTLIAEGTENNPILFKSALNNPTNNSWDGLIINQGSAVTLSHIVIKHAKTALTMPAGNVSHITMDSCLNGFNIQGDAAGLQVTYCVFNNVNHVYQVYSNHIQFSHCEFSNSKFEFQNCDTTSFVKESFFDNSEIVIGMISNTYNVQAYFVNNIMTGTFQKTGIKIDTYSGLKPRIINNTITGYRAGIYCLKSDLLYGEGVSQPIIRNNILYLNQISNDFEGTFCPPGGTATYNCVYNRDTQSYTPPANNIETDPLFVNPSSGDYRLAYNSPCIDAGDTNDAYYDEPEPNGGRINIGHHGNTAEATGTFDLVVTDNLQDDAEWDGQIMIANDVSTNGHNLTVNSGARVYFENGKSLTAGGVFSSVGSYEHPVIYRAWRGTDVMNGVILTGDANADIRYSEFRYANTALTLDEYARPKDQEFSNLTFDHNTTGVFMNKADAVFRNSYFNDNRTGLLCQKSNLILSGSNLNNNTEEGLYLFDEPVFEISGCQFNGNGKRGVYFHTASDGRFDSSIVSGNAGESNLEPNLKAGLIFYQSSPFLRFNQITGNYAPGILSMSSSAPVMFKGANNFIANNRESVQQNDPDILVKDFSFPVIQGGHNDILDEEGGYLIYGDEDDREIVLNVSENYWGTTDENEILSRLYRRGGFIITPIDNSPNWEAVIVAEELLLFARAADLEKGSDYTSAYQTYDSILANYQASHTSKAALQRSFVCRVKSGQNSNQVRSYLAPLLSHSDEQIVKIAKRLTYRSYTNETEYDQAIQFHDQWRNATADVNDSLYSSVDILTNELLRTGGRIAKAAGSTGAFKKTAQVRNYKKETDRILSGAFARTSEDRNNDVPQTFGLSQNYPNPFNPTTTIKYQLPFASKVTVKIYNILGQEVSTLVNKQQAAGYYTLNWNGKSDIGRQVTSGVYIYRIVAKSADKTFVKSKKMMLIR